MNTLQDKKEEIFIAIQQNQELYRPSKKKLLMLIGRVMDQGLGWSELFDKINATQALFPREQKIACDIVNRFYNSEPVKKRFDPLAAIFNFFK
jgi:hypothetical protein